MSSLPTDVRSIARDAYTFGYAMIENYRTLYEQAVDADDPRYTGGFGHYRHYSEPFTPANTDIVTPNNDTPYSWGWFDLRAEPWVITVPAIDRFYILPFHDLYTVYAGYVSAATTGTGAGRYLLAGPSWTGGMPDGFDGVITSSTDFVGCLGRTAFTDGDRGRAAAHPAVVRRRPVPRATPAPTAPATEAIDWPTWDEAAATDIRFFDTLDFLLRFAPVLDEDRDIRDRLASVGLDGSGTLPLRDARRRRPGRLRDRARRRHRPPRRGRRPRRPARPDCSAPGTRWRVATTAATSARRRACTGCLPRSPGTAAGSSTPRATTSPGDTDYTITFTADQLPKARFFWSATLYTLPQRLLSANEIDRYSIGDRTPGIRYADDGSLTLFVQHRRPDDPGEAANWLPSPEGPFTVIIRAYGGDEPIADGHLPPTPDHST